MNKLIKTSFNILKNNMIFIQPLLLYLLLFLYLMSLLYKNGNTIAITLVLITILMSAFAFYSGYFYINKLGVETYNTEDNNEEITHKSLENYKKFIAGIGENFFRLIGAYILFSVIFTLIFLGVNVLLNKTIGPNLFSAVLYSPEIIKTLTTEELINNSAWFINMALFFIITQYCFITYNASLFFDKKNIFISLLNTIKFLFKEFGLNVAILLFLSFLQIIINAIISIFGNGAIAASIFLIISTIYFNFYIVLVFRFYYEKTQINSDNRAEFIG